MHPHPALRADLSLEGRGGTPTRLIERIGIGGSRGGRGSTSNLKSMGTDLVAALRQDPNAPLKSPFGDP